MKKIIVLAVMMAVTGSLSVSAAVNKSQELAEKLLITMEVPQNIEKTFSMIKKMQMTYIERMQMGKAKTQQAEKVQATIMDLMQKELSWDKMKAEYIDIYAQTFSEQELKDLINFYASPIGKKFVGKQTELSQKSRILMEKKMQAIAPQIRQLAGELTQQQNTAPAAAPTMAPAKPVPVQVPLSVKNGK